MPFAETSMWVEVLNMYGIEKCKTYFYIVILSQNWFGCEFLNLLLLIFYLVFFFQYFFLDLRSQNVK